MEYTIRSIIKAVFAAVITFLFSKGFVAIEWGFHSPSIISYAYYIMQILIISFLMKRKTLKQYSVSVICFILSSIVIRLLSADIDMYIFKSIFGLDSNMGTGDGFMLLFMYMVNLVIYMLGLGIALIITIYISKKQND